MGLNTIYAYIFSHIKFKKCEVQDWHGVTVQQHRQGSSSSSFLLDTAVVCPCGPRWQLDLLESYLHFVRQHGGREHRMRSDSHMQPSLQLSSQEQNKVHLLIYPQYIITHSCKGARYGLYLGHHDLNMNIKACITMGEVWDKV